MTMETTRTITSPILETKILLKNWLTGKERERINKAVAKGIVVDPITRQAKNFSNEMALERASLKVTLTLDAFILELDGLNAEAFADKYDGKSFGVYIMENYPEDDMKFIEEEAEAGLVGTKKTKS